MTGSGRERGNCIAVGFRAHLAEENVPPGAAFFAGDGKLERGFASGVTEDCGTGKEPPTQRGQFSPLGLIEPTLQTDTQIVGADGQVIGGLGGPKRAAAKSLQVELCAEFLGPVLDIRAAL